VLAARPTTRALATVLAAGAVVVTVAALPAAAAAASPLASDGNDPVWVSAGGVAFPPGRADGAVRYGLRGLDSSSEATLTEPVPDGAGWVPFSGAGDAMPDGRCVTWVQVPGAGEWTEGGWNRACTGTSPADDPTPSATPTPSADPSPAASSATPTPEPSGTPSATPTGEPSASAGASGSPAPSASPSPSTDAVPSASPSPSASASPSAAAVASPSPSPDSSAAALQGQLLQDSFTRDASTKAATEPTDAAGTGPLWSAVGMLVAVGAITAGGVGAWRAQRRGDGA